MCNGTYRDGVPTTVATRADRRRRALADAAYALLAEGGLEAVTAEAVAHRAGVSRRTLFNYFPSAESALTASITDWVAELTEAVRARPDDEPVMDALVAAIADGPRVELLEQIRTLVEASQTSPGARRFLAEFSLARSEANEQVLLQRLGNDADPLMVSFTARGLVAAAEAATHLWMRQAHGPVTPESAARFRHLFLDALEMLRRGIDDPIGR